MNTKKQIIETEEEIVNVTNSIYEIHLRAQDELKKSDHPFIAYYQTLQSNLIGLKNTIESAMPVLKELIDKHNETTTIRTVDENGIIRYHLNNRLHRVDGPAIESPEGVKYYFIHGKLHREGGPAIEFPGNGYKAYCINGQFHREYGPAIEYASGVKLYFIHGNQLTEQEFNNRQL